MHKNYYFCGTQQNYRLEKMTQIKKSAPTPSQVITPASIKAGLPDKFVITVGRRMGSGGRALGRLLADKLGIAFYDKELLMDAARRAGLCPEVFERNDERRPHFINGLFSFNMGMNAMPSFTASSISDDALYKAQCDFIHEIAATGPCVIVGRSADYVLRDTPNVVNIFVHAELDDCARRIAGRDKSLTFEQARRVAEKINKLRANFYNFYTDKRWGDSSAYDLTFNSSTTDLEHIADMVVDYLHRRLGAEKATL